MEYRNPKQNKSLLHRIKKLFIKCEHEYELVTTRELMGIETEIQKCKLCKKSRCR